MKSWAWLIVVLIAFPVVGCREKRQEIKPVDVGKTTDATLTQYQQVDLAQTSEVDLVEELQRVRADYIRLLGLLRQWYLDNGYYEKSIWAGRELSDFGKIRTYPYLTVIEVVQVPDEAGAKEVVQADELFASAVKLYEEGQILPLLNDMAKLKESLELFQKVVRDYPQSSKAPESAFYAAEILKEYLDENLQALEYYKLALKMDPEIKKPVRFQTAVLLDFRLHDRDGALKMYRRVLSEEPDIDRSNVWFSRNRIRQLVKEHEGPGEAAPSSVEPKPTTQPDAGE